MTRARASPTCKVCRLPAGERDLVEGGLLAGWSARSVAERFGTITRKDVVRHAKICDSEGKEQ